MLISVLLLTPVNFCVVEFQFQFSRVLVTQYHVHRFETMQISDNNQN